MHGTFKKAHLIASCRGRSLRGASAASLTVLLACATGGDQGGAREGTGQTAQASSIVSGNPGTISYAPPALAWPGAASASPTVDTLAGEGRIETDGQYHYTLSLDAPPGRAGMQPHLSVAYSSGEGNGLLGVGFTLTGAEPIKTCDANFAHENVAQTNGAVCLGAGHLIQLADGTYRLDNDVSSKIVGTPAGSSSAMATYQVWTKDGRILTYGPQIGLDWPLTQERDHDNNVVTYGYTVVSAAAPFEYILQNINYTGRYNPANQTVTPGKRNVSFAYQPRADVVTTGEARMSQLLQQVSFYAPQPTTGTSTSTNFAWSYTFHYLPSGATLRSLLQSVDKAGSSGGRTYIKNFGWNSDSGFQVLTFPLPATNVPPLFPSWTAPPQFPGLDTFGSVVADINGDGLDDVLTEYYPGEVFVSISASAGNTFFNTSKLNQLSAVGTLADAHLGDINGDGLPELIAPDRQFDAAGVRPYRVYTWQSGDFQATTTTLSTYVDGHDPDAQPNPLYLADQNGDGLLDLVEGIHDVNVNFAGPDPSYGLPGPGQPQALSYSWFQQTNTGGGQFGAPTVLATSNVQPIAEVLSNGSGGPSNTPVQYWLGMTFAAPATPSQFSVQATYASNGTHTLWGWNFW
jgi:hypothetical protein